MARKRYPIIAPEGVPVLLLALGGVVAAFHWLGWIAALPVLLATVALVLLFRDPARDVPAAPSMILAPCDGIVAEISSTDETVLEREATRITIRVDNFGAYTARSPIEGKVLDPRDNVQAGSRLLGINGLWVRSDEGDDVVTLLRGPRWIGAPKAFIRYGERIGQGQRCAYLRLARRADVLVPASAKVRVEPGERVAAGVSEIAKIRNS